MEKINFINEDNLYSQIKNLIQIENEISNKVKMELSNITDSLPIKKKSKLNDANELVKGKYALVLVESIMKIIEQYELSISNESVEIAELNIDKEVEKRLDEVIDINFISLPKKEQESIQLNLGAVDRVFEKMKTKNY